MQAPALTTAHSNAATANNTTTTNSTATTNNTANKPLDTIRGLTRFEKDVNEKVSFYFEDIIERLKGPLLDDLRKSKKSFRPFAIRLLVLGVDESSAKPYIVVFCPACVRGLVDNYFRRGTPQRLCQPGKDGPASFEVIVEGNPIRPKTSQHLHPTSVKTGHPISGRRRHTNTPLKIDGICGTRYATMGGYIIVVNKDEDLSLYGLTAGHSIVQDNLEEEVDSEQASEEPDEEQSLFPEITTPPPSQVPGSVMSRTMHNTTFNRATNTQEEIEWSGNANVAPSSFLTQACDRDWALLAGLAFQSASATEDDTIYERYLLGHPRSGTALMDDGVEVALHPPFIGKLSRLPSFAILPYGNDFVRVHTIIVHHNRRIPAGSSGAWVSTERTEPTSRIRPQSATAAHLDERPSRNMTVFGQVVADDVLGDIYMVPLCDIFEDVKQALDAREVRLPQSTAEIDHLLRFMNSITITSSENEAEDQDQSGLPDMAFCTRCGSDQHTKELCGIEDPSFVPEESPEKSLGESFGAASMPTVIGAYTPSTYAVNSKSKETVWFCSGCSDGPNSGWQNLCPGCGHVRCRSCRIEETG